MIKSKKMIIFSRGRLMMKMKKMYQRQLNWRNFMRIQEVKKMKNNSLKFLELCIMNCKIH